MAISSAASPDLDVLKPSGRRPAPGPRAGGLARVPRRGGRVLSLQGSHPTVAKGLYDHSTVLTDPLGRGPAHHRATRMRILFGSDRPGTAAEIRELHRDIKGTGFDGRPYHAWNREAWTWVHLTTFEALLYGLRAVARRHPPLELPAGPLDWFKDVGLMSRRARSGHARRHRRVARLHPRRRSRPSCTHVPDLSLFQRQPRPSGLPIPDRCGAGWSDRRASPVHRSPGPSRRRSASGGESGGARCTRPPTRRNSSRSEPRPRPCPTGCGCCPTPTAPCTSRQPDDGGLRYDDDRVADCPL